MDETGTSNNYTVYILSFDDGKYYVGITNDLRRRIYHHSYYKTNSKVSTAISAGIEFSVCIFCKGITKEEALQLEVQISAVLETVENGYNKYVGVMSGENHPSRGKPSPFKGKKHTPETKELLSRLKSGAGGVWFGKKRPEHSEFMKKHSPTKGKLPKTAKKVVCSITGKVFESTRLAAEYLGINHITLIGYLNGNRKNRTSMRRLE